MSKANPKRRAKAPSPTSNPTPLRRSPRLHPQKTPGDGSKTPPLTKVKNAPPPPSTTSKEPPFGPKTRSLRKLASTHFAKFQQKRGSGGSLGRSPRFCNVGVEKKKKKALEITEARTRRRSPRLSLLEERKSADTQKPHVVAKLLNGDVENSGTSRKRSVSFVVSTPSRSGGGKRSRVVNRRFGDEGGVGKNLGDDSEVAVSLVEKEEEEEEETVIPCSGNGDAVGRIGVVCRTAQRDKFSTPRGRIEKGKRSGKSGDGGGDQGSLVEVLGWTCEQDKALQMAYLRARPSPHFWKKVAKMVPGKSAKECFDRIHSNYVTPPLPRRHPRTNVSNLSPVSHFNLSASKASNFFQETIKKVKSKKQQKLLAQRTVRHILRKHCSADQGREADLFPVFQACIDASAMDTMCTNTSAKDSSILSTCLLNSNDKQPNARSLLPAKLRSLDKENKPSPEVLKKLRNPILHEKYIDQLHRREAGWKVSGRVANSSSKIGLANAMPRRDTVKNARSALLLEAREAITQFQHSKLPFNNCAGSNDENFDDGSNESDIEDTVVDFC